MVDEQPVETTLYSLDESAPAPLQRRTSERHLTLLRVGSLMIDDRRELCLIRNISAGGMMIRAYSRVQPGVRLSIELKQGEPLNATVQWASDGNLGVSFDAPIDVIDLISASANGPRPRMPRIQVQSTASVRQDSTIYRTNVCDISQGGVKVVSGRTLVVGAEAVVTLNGIAPIPAIVKWQDGEAYGITFNRPLGLPVLVAWLQELQDRSRRSVA